MPTSHTYSHRKNRLYQICLVSDIALADFSVRAISYTVVRRLTLSGERKLVAG